MTAVTDEARLAVLRSLELLDKPAEPELARLTRLAARLLRAPTALVSLVDANRQFFQTAVGLGEPWATRRETPLTHSFCKTVVTTGRALVVDDARIDERVRENLAIRDLGVVAYAGVPLVADKQIIGALCVIDAEAHKWRDEEIEILNELAATVEQVINLRQSNRELERVSARLDQQTAILQKALACLPDAGVVIFDRDLRFVAAEGTGLARVGLPREKMIGRLASEVHLPENMARVEGLYRRALEGGPGSGELTRGGRRFDVHTVPLPDENGEIHQGMLVLYDTTERNREATILRTLTRALPNAAVAIFDDQLRYQFADGSILREVTGWDAAAFPGKHLSEALQEKPGQARSIELYQAALAGRASQRELVRDGRVYDHHIVPVYDGTVVVAGLALIYDITDAKRESEELARAHQQLGEQAELLRQASITDELTGLHNRRGFTLLGEHSLRQAARDGKSVTLFFLDLNGMKKINDDLGHEHGDRALVETAALLRRCFRQTDVLSRLGGDEFAVLAVGSGADAIAPLTERIVAAASDFNSRAEAPFVLSISAGAVVGDESSSLEKLLVDADALMYAHKREMRARRGA